MTRATSDAGSRTNAPWPVTGKMPRNGATSGAVTPLTSTTNGDSVDAPNSFSMKRIAISTSTTPATNQTAWIARQWPVGVVRYGYTGVTVSGSTPSRPMGAVGGG